MAPVSLTSYRLTLPKLKEDQKSFNESNVITFLKKNINIETLTIEHLTLNVLNQINENLKNLQNLSLISVAQNYLGKYNGVEIQMNSVKELLIESINAIPKTIFFNQLDSLKLIIDGKFTKDWFSFLMNQINSNLTKLEIHTNELKEVHFSKIPDKFPKLESVYIWFKSYIFVREVQHFVEKCKNAQKIALKGELYGIHYTYLKRYFKYKQWKMEIDNSDPSPLTIKVTFIR